MKITLLTPAYNSAATLRDTLESIAAQRYPDLEYILIDGASTDGTADLVTEYGDLATIFRSEPDRGIYDAMNKGLRLATGDVIGILNSDDFYAGPEVLRKVAAAFADPSVDTLYGDLQYVDALRTERVVRHWRAGGYRRSKFLFGWMPPHPTFFVRRRCYEQFGLFDLDLRSAADYELMLRFLYKERCSAHYLPEVMVKMRTGGQSNASLRHRLRANREDALAWRKNGLRPYFFTTWLKPLRKVGQYF